MPPTRIDPAPPETPLRWFSAAWRRAAFDMHLSDWDPRFLSRFDPDEFIAAAESARVQSVVFAAQSHTGLFNYPTRVGRQHAALQGRDIVAEMLGRCRERGIAFVVYASLIFDRWAYDTHPEWRGRDVHGAEWGAGSRYGVVCPNSPYRDYVRAWTRELCERYAFDGVRFDMAYWPAVCYCDHCRGRWEREAGGDMPRAVDWMDERWVGFQRRREAWMGDFAAIATGTVRRIRPGASVEHQAATFPAPWNKGVSHPSVDQNDFLQGDFYGGPLQGSFARKFLGELSPHRPFCFETSASLDLRDHTSRKSEALLETKASAAIADHSAFLYIDGIDPVGTPNRATHERMGRVFERLLPYYPELGGDRVADVGVYYSMDSKFDMRDRQIPREDADPPDTHTQSATNAVCRLGSSHVPFRVITSREIGRLGRNRVLILPNVHHLSPEEAGAIREFVRQGGALYASAGSSLVTTQGRRMPDFQLADVFGVSLARADWTHREHYVSPTEAGAADFAGWERKHPPMVKGHGFEVTAHPGAEVLATTTLPWPAPHPTWFSSIHSNPPWVETENPEVVFHRFGDGRAVYCSSPLEDSEGLQEVFIRLLRRLQPSFTFEADAPRTVELGLFHQPERRRHVLSLLSFQQEQPNVPVDGIQVRLRLPFPVTSIVQLPGSGTLAHTAHGGVTSFTAPRLRTLSLFALNHA